MRLLARSAFAIVGVLAVAGCATEPIEPEARAQFRANHDPFEPLNRETFALNQSIDRMLIKPIAKGYRSVVPDPARNGLRHFLDNLNEPIVFANTVLQGRLRDAGTTGARFLLNTTAGVAGFRDVASRNRLPKKIGDFGQTLWAWGVPEGPYIIVPILGPTNPRDGVGSGVDAYIDPFRYVARADHFGSYVTGGRAVLDGIDTRSRSIDALDEMEKEAIDYYASFRSLFRQHRAAELTGSDHPAQLPSPDFYEDPGR
jgi:phospholipid-binding lipoprotein MlaA